MDNCRLCLDYGLAGLGNFPSDFPSLRLDGDDDRCEGVVHHRHDNDWLPLCITYFSRNLESLICREMKCGPPISHHPIDHLPLYNSSTALSVTCPLLGDWRNCSVSPVPATECDGAAFLYCAEERLLRLSGGGSPCAGRVEVLKDDVWGAVCDDHWDALDAEVVCRQLSCGSALAAYGASHFGVGPPQIHLDDVRCSGSEPFLWECPSERRHDCTEREHAGVMCTGHHEVRLSGGPNNCSGRLEVYMDGVWATVCDGSWFHDDSAKVCKALGCGSFVKNAKYEHTLSTSVTFLCSHSYSLWDCKILTKNPNTCRQAKAVGIVCNRSGDFYDEMTTVTSSTHSDPTSLQTGSPPFRSDSTHSYFVIVCALLLILLLMSVLVFTTIIWRLRLKKKSTEQNPSLVRHNEYRDFRASTLRPAQPPDDSLQIPILYTGHIPPSPRTRHMEPVPAAIPRVPPTAALDDEEDYGFSSTPPKPLATFQDSFREDVFSAPPPPPPMTEYPNPEKASVGSRSSSSTSSGEHNWYENYRYPGEGAQDLMPPPQSYDGSSEYDDVNSLASV